MPGLIVAFQDRPDRGLLNMGEHPEYDLSCALNHSKDWRLFLSQSAATAIPSCLAISPELNLDGDQIGQQQLAGRLDDPNQEGFNRESS